MTNSDKLEFIGQIIDIFEDFLDERVSGSTIQTTTGIPSGTPPATM